ncbi:MAG: hypothetical protein JWR84_3926 [Caulobacter sp.]|nr:hypothetical protein [Caulobacter sp.]
MRLAVLAATLAVVGPVSAADAPTRVDLVVEGQVAEIDYAHRSDWPKDVDPTLLRSHHHVYLLNIAVGRTLGGAAPGTGVRVYTDHQNWFPTPNRPAVFWLRQDAEGRWRLICAQDALSPALAASEARELQADWRSHPDCSPPADLTYEPGG